MWLQITWTIQNRVVTKNTDALLCVLKTHFCPVIFSMPILKPPHNFYFTVVIKKKKKGKSSAFPWHRENSFDFINIMTRTYYIMKLSKRMLYLFPVQMTIWKLIWKTFWVHECHIVNERHARGTTDLKNNNMFGHNIKLED